MQTPDEMIAAIEAFKRDGKVMCSSLNGSTPYQVANPMWSFKSSNYYPIPIPKPKEIRVNEYATEVHAFRSEQYALDSVFPGVIRKAVRYVEADPQ